MHHSHQSPIVQHEENLQRRAGADLSSLPSEHMRGNPLALVIGLVLCITPLFLVTIRGWSSGMLLLGGFACFTFLVLSRRGRAWGSWRNGPLEVLAAATLLSPIIAIAISSALRESLYLPQFDSPARFCVAIAILVFAIRTKFDASKYLEFTFPAALFLTLAQQYVVIQPMQWGPGRMSTYFADPLVFGYVCMTFALISAMSINLREKDSTLVVAFKLVGASAGFYLSIKSGSRTGWLAIPIVLALWAYLQTGSYKSTRVFAVVGLSCVISVLVYLTSSTVHPRIDLLANEIATYPWVGIAPETAVGSRITFLRIAGDLVFERPWGGFGDTRFEQFSVPSTIRSYASEATLHTAFHSGFHNEIVTNMIRSGVFGLVSSASLFLVPFVIFLGKLKSANQLARANAVMGTTFIICMFISSLSTEILDLKYMASFYALMIALLCGSTLARHEQN